MNDPMPPCCEESTAPLEARVAELTIALQKYGDHTVCSYYDPPKGEPTLVGGELVEPPLNDCDCGWDEVAAALEETPQ